MHDYIIDDEGRTLYLMSDILMDHEFNCRGTITPLDVAELAKDIEHNGLLQPVGITELDDDDKVTYPDKKYRLISGFRRTMAHKVIGFDRVWAHKMPIKDKVEARFFNLRENLQRKELTFAQEAEALRPFFNLKLTRKEIVARTGMNDGWVQLRTMYLQMPEVIQKEVQTGSITQMGIREIHTALIRNGETAAIQVAKEIKDAKIKGLKTMPRALAKLQNRDRKTTRSKPEVNWLTERIVDMIGAGLTTRCLAWCAGEISDSELEESLRTYAGEDYQEPRI